jgi:E3 Ubiquitin ligase
LADPADPWFWLLNLGVAVTAGAWFAFRWLHAARLVEDTPTSRLRSAAQGYVEIEGRARPLAAEHAFAPLTRRDCVWWRYRIQHRSDSGSDRRREQWRMVASGRSETPFVIDDGECIVQPSGATVLPSESTTWYGATPWPTAAPGQIAALTGRDYRYYEERIHVHELVYALGGFRSVSGTDVGGTDDAVRSLLGEWKQDQEELKQRFDRDADGTVSLAEWEQARAAARASVELSRAERPAETARHVLARPNDGQLFLLATFRGADLARRLRRRAWFAFAGFGAAVYALGWLLQGWIRNA